MKIFIFPLVLMSFYTPIAHADQTTPSLGTTQTQLPTPTPYHIIDHGLNNRVWQRETYQTGAKGLIVTNLTRYTELATGMYYTNSTGQLVEAQEQIDLLPDGTAAAIQGQHQAYFPADIYNGVIELVTPDGQHLQSQPMGLSYDDGTNTVLIATLTNSIGQLVNSNQIVYPNAFAGLHADLRYTYTKGGFEQDVILQEQPPLPEQFGLNSGSTALQVLTKFVSAPAPAIATNQTASEKGNSLADVTLDFGVTKMGRGKAFLTGQNSLSAVKVAKQWLKVNGQTILAESVKVSAITNQLNQLPASQSADARPIENYPLYVVSTKHLLPESRGYKPRGGDSIKLTRRTNDKPALVLDYMTLNYDTNNFTFQSGQTYYISGNVNLSGTTIFEDAVLKYPEPYGGFLNLAGPFHCLTSANLPAIFTSMNDNTAGSTISGSSGSPAYVSGGFIWNSRITYNNSGTNALYQHLRFYYGGWVSFPLGEDANGAIYDEFFTAQDVQFVNCLWAIDSAAGDGDANHPDVILKNVLFAHCGLGIAPDSSAFQGPGFVEAEQVTVDDCVQFTSQGDAFVTNCIFADATNLSAYGCYGATMSGTHNGFYNSPEFGTSPVTNTFYPFTASGLASNYLVAGTSFRDVGTTNLDTNLLAELQITTTYAPQDGNYPDTNTPDLGYHYPLVVPPQIQDGSFELPYQSGGETSGAPFSTNGWNFNTSASPGFAVFIAANGAYWAAAVNAPDGSQAAVMLVNSTTHTTISQILTNLTAGTYTLYFYAALSKNASGTSPDLAILLDGVTNAYYFAAAGSSYALFSTNLTLTAGTHTLEFDAVENNFSATEGICIDQIYFGSPPPPRGPTNIVAASGNDYDVAAAINTPIVPPMGGIAGDTVQIPAGTWYWTNGNVNFAGITLQGAGTNMTYIIDDLNIINSDSAQPLLIAALLPRTFTRLTQMTLGGYNSVLNYKGKVYMDGTIYGTNAAWRIDHCVFTNLNGDNIFAYGFPISCVDHCSFYLAGEAIHQIGIDTNDPYGGLSYHRPSDYGSSNVLCIENNYFQGIPIGGAFDLGAYDAEYGARSVFRFNTLTNSGWYTHGLDSTYRARSVRQYELYGNTFSYTPGQNATKPFEFRGGTGLCFSNTVINAQSFNTMLNFRCSENLNFGGADGLNTWDSNNPTLFASGVMTGVTIDAAHFTYVTSTNIWITNQWVGYVLYDTNSALRGGTRYFGLIQANDNHTITLQAPKNGPSDMVAGDAFGIRFIGPTLDQVGRGSGDLIINIDPDGITADTYTINQMTGTNSWPHQLLDPLYYWANTFNGSPVGIMSGLADIIDGRDLTNSVKTGYIPLIYPHPLDK